jgi:hypothetical protein
LQRVNAALPAPEGEGDIAPITSAAAAAAAAEAECPRFVARLADAVRRRVQNIPAPPKG